MSELPVPKPLSEMELPTEEAAIVVCALALTSLLRPGWSYICRLIAAERLQEGDLFDMLRAVNQDQVLPHEVVERRVGETTGDVPVGVTHRWHVPNQPYDAADRQMLEWIEKQLDRWNVPRTAPAPPGSPGSSQPGAEELTTYGRLLALHDQMYLSRVRLVPSDAPPPAPAAPE